MKAWKTLLLALPLAVLVGCGGSGDSNTGFIQNPTTPEQTFEPDGPNVPAAPEDTVNEEQSSTEDAGGVTAQPTESI